MTPAERAELRRMGERLIAIADGNPVGDAMSNGDPLVEAAWREINRRKGRKRVVPAELLGEPAWDILLDLFVMPAMGKRVSVTSSSIAGDVPLTTGLRWVNALVDRGYAVREPDPADARRSFVRLSVTGRDMIADAMRISLQSEQLSIEVHRRRLLERIGAHEEIARELKISVPTVRMHRANMMDGMDPSPLGK